MMKSITLKVVLLSFAGALMVSGCANPNASNQMESATQQASPAQQPGLVESTAKDMPPLHAPAVQVSLDQVYFSYDQSTLSAQARDILSKNALTLKSTPDLRVSIEGHCDDRGSDEYNLALGDRRAREVHNYLVSLGIAPERMETVSYGEEMPVDRNQNEIAWAKNRRAEFKKLN